MLTSVTLTSVEKHLNAIWVGMNTYGRLGFVRRSNLRFAAQWERLYYRDGNHPFSGLNDTFEDAVAWLEAEGFEEVDW